MKQYTFVEHSLPAVAEDNINGALGGKVDNLAQDIQVVAGDANVPGSQGKVNYRV